MIRNLLWYFLVVCMSVEAVELDSQYYPERLQWHELESFDDPQDQRQLYHWDQGLYFRLTSDEVMDGLSLWYSTGDGLFQQLQPKRKVQYQQRWQWLYVRPQQEHAIVMLQDQREHDGWLEIEQSAHSTAPLLNPVNQVILHSAQQLSTNRADGFERQVYNHIYGGQSLTYQLQGPARYQLVLRTKWLAQYGLSEQVALKLQIADQDPLNPVVKLQPQTDYLLQTPDCDCVYSRQHKINLSIPEGEHQVKLWADRDILAFWSRSNESQQYFYHHNSAEPLAHQLDANINEPDIEPTYFYRELSPLGSHRIEPYQPLVTDGNKAKSWLPSGEYSPLPKAFFGQIKAADMADYQLPPAAIQPPLRLYLLAQASDQTQFFSLISNEGEKIRFFYDRDIRLKQGLNFSGLSEARLRLSGESLEQVRLVAKAQISFTRPFKRLQLHNEGELTLGINLSYRNRSKLKTDEIGFANTVDAVTALSMIAALGQGQPPQLNHLLHSEIETWQRRLNTRAERFIGLYPALGSQNIQLLYQQISQVLPQLGQFNQMAHQSLADLVVMLEANGLALKAKKLVVALALDKDQGYKWQTQAQQLLLAQLTAQQRWFDIEGYWAYRLLHWQQHEAIPAIADALLAQNQFEQASKWYWLAYQAGLLPQIPDLALFAAKQANAPQLFERWLTLLERERRLAWSCVSRFIAEDCQPLVDQPQRYLPKPWFYWNAIDVSSYSNSGRTLIYNHGLDSYMSATELNAGQVVTMRLEGPLKLKLTLYPRRKFTPGQGLEPERALAWLNLNSDKRQRRYILNDLFDSINLSLASHPDDRLISPKSIIFELEQGEQLSAIQLDGIHGLFKLQQRDELLSQWLTLKEQTEEVDDHWLERLASNKKHFEQQYAPTEPSQPQRKPQQKLQASLSLTLDNDPLSMTPAWELSKQMPQSTSLFQAIDQQLAKGTPARLATQDQWLLQAIWLQQQQPLIPELNAALKALTPQAPWQRRWQSLLAQNQSWHPIQAVSNSGGEQSFELERWQPSSPYLSLQQALFTDTVKAGERLLPQRDHQVIELHNSESQTLELNLRHIARLGDKQAPATVVIELDGKKQSLVLLPGQSKNTRLSIPKGVHQLRLYLLDDPFNPLRSWLFYRLDLEQQPLGLTRRKYWVATETQPLVVHVPQASWLRVDELNAQGQLVHQNRYIAKAGAIRFKPQPGQEARYLRVYQWQSDLYTPKLAPPVAPAYEPKAMITAVNHQWMSEQTTQYQWFDRYPLKQQNDGSWGLFAGYRARRNFDEDEQTSRERFYQVGGQYLRQIPQWDAYIRNNLSVRKHHDSNLETAASENRVWWLASKFWQFSATLNGYYQLDAEQPSVVDGWSVYGAMSGNWKQYWQYNLTNDVILTAYSRALSLAESDVYPGHNEGPNNVVVENGVAVDDDVYSDYKEDHRFGLILADTLVYRPWLDTRIRLHGALSSDNNGNFFKPHKLSLSLGWWQYYQPFVFRIDLQRNRYYRNEADADSLGGFDINTIRLGLDWEKWSYGGQLWQVKSYLRRDLDGAGSSFGVNLFWGETDGQGFDDFAPASLSFGGLRKRASFHQIESNQVVRDDHE